MPNPDQPPSLISLLADAVRTQSVEAEAGGLHWTRMGIVPVYVISTYGLATFVVALVLNRTTVIASAARTHGRGPRGGAFRLLRKMPVSQGAVLAALRAVATYVLLRQAHRVLVALSVVGQNSAAPCAVARLAAAHLHYDPAAYAGDRYMAMPANEVRFGPTCDMLWPVFVAVCVSSFVETFAAALGGRRPQLDGGITLLELSVSFHEMSSGFFFPRGAALAMRPTEPLLAVCLVSLAEHVCGHVGAVLGSNRYRLVPSAVVNGSFLWYFASCALAGGVFRFPLPVLVTYTSLLLTVCSVVVCFAIFALAVVTKGADMDELNFMSFFPESHPDRAFFSETLNLGWDMDFYTAALNLGMIAVTSAGKSSYITEYCAVQAPVSTWFERDVLARLQRAFDFSALDNDAEMQGKRLLRYLRENHVSGYGNVVPSPTPRMVAATRDRPAASSPQIKRRYMFTKEILARLGDLALSYVSRFFRCATQKLGAAKRPQTPEQKLEALRASAPAFVRHLIKEPEETSAKYSLKDISDEELERAYGTILAGHELDDVDDSPDFELESELESDAEEQNLQEPAALSELLSADTFVELLEEKDVLRRHLDYNPGSGVMTRSRYRSNGQRDQAEQLAELLVSRSGAATADDARFTCVICQVEPREIITWPCKCFAICEACRVSVAAKGIDGCVCCRRDVEGVSRLFIP